jgi:hypothetical protein
MVEAADVKLVDRWCDYLVKTVEQHF